MLATVATHAFIAALRSAVVAHWSGFGVRSAGKVRAASAPVRPSRSACPDVPSGTTVAVGSGVVSVVVPMDAVGAGVVISIVGAGAGAAPSAAAGPGAAAP